MRGLVLLVVLLLEACGPKTESGERPPSVTVRVDRRVELASLVARLAKTPEFLTAPSSAYVRELDRAFGKLAEHPAVVALRGVPAAAVIEEALGGDGAALRSFAAASEFDTFFDRHAPAYARISDTLRTVVESGDPIRWFEQTIGPREHARLTVVPAPAAGAQTHVVRTGQDLYFVVGVRRPDGMVGTDDETLAQVIVALARTYVDRDDAARALAVLYLRDKRIASRIEAPAELVELFDKNRGRALDQLGQRR